MWARGDAVIAVDTDDAGVPWLVRNHVSRAPWGNQRQPGTWQFTSS